MTRHHTLRAPARLALAGVLCLCVLGVAAPAAAAPACWGRRATIVGSDRADTLRGTDGADVIAALGGNDTVYGMETRDWICGGTGDDRLYGGQGRDKLRGGSGRDLIIGGVDIDRVHAGSGADRVRGGDGRDSIAGEAGADVLHGDAHGDSINGGGGANAIYGGAGPDSLTASPSAETISGGDGQDALGVAGDACAQDRVRVNLTKQTFRHDGRTTTLQSIDGATMFCRADADLIGDEGPNTLTYRGYGRAWVYGRGGNDRLENLAARDQTVDPVIAGGAGDDVMTFQRHLSAEHRIDLFGGDGTDHLFFEYSSVTVDLPNDVFTSGSASGTVADVEDVTGWSGRDHFIGDDNANVLSGGGGADDIHGGAGDDRLYGFHRPDPPRFVPLDEHEDDAGDSLIGGAGDDFADGFDHPDHPAVDICDAEVAVRCEAAPAS